MTNVTYSTSVTVDYPDYTSQTVVFRNVTNPAPGSGNELVGSQSITTTLDGSGQATESIPTPDNTGEAAFQWDISTPDGEVYSGISIAYDASPQSLQSLIASGVTLSGPTLVGVTSAQKTWVGSSLVAMGAGTTGNILIVAADDSIADGGAPPATLADGTDITFTESPAGTFTPNLVATGVGAGSVSTYVAQLTRDANGRITAITAGQLTDNGDNTHTLADGLIITAPTGVESLHVTDVDGGGALIERDDGANSYKFKVGHGNASGQKIEGARVQLVHNAAADLSGASTTIMDIDGATNVTWNVRQSIVITNAFLQCAQYKAASSQSVNVVEYLNSGGSIMSAIAKNGAFKPASLADSAAENNTVYYSTTQSKLVYKDGAGAVNNLY